MKDKQFELKSDKHSFINQVVNDSLWFTKDKLYNKYKQVIYAPIILEKLKRMLDNNTVVYEIVGEDTKFSVDLLIEMIGFQRGINNCYDDTKQLLILGRYFPIGITIIKVGKLFDKPTFWIKDSKDIFTSEGWYTIG